MFRITEDPSSGSLVQCLAKSYKNDTIVSIDMNKVGAMAEYSDPLCVRSTHTRTTGQNMHAHNRSGYAAITPTMSMSMDTIESFL